MRVFVAIFPPPEVQSTLLRAAQDAQITGNIRWVPRENVHLTLKFLGDATSDELEGVRDALEKVARRHGSFRIQPSGLGAFPSGRKARVLWTGVGEGFSRLTAMAAGVEELLEPLGFGRNLKPYKPHITLGRVRGRPASLPDRSDVRAPEFTTRRLDLVESVLGADDATYENLESYPLSGEL